MAYRGRTAAQAPKTLPPPPPVPANVVPSKANSEDFPESSTKILKATRYPMPRPGFAHTGRPIQLVTNHFGVKVTKVDGYFFHYSVSLMYEDGHPVDDGKDIGRRVIDRLQETYASELDGKDFAYDGEKSLFTVGPLPRNKLDFIVVLEDISSNRTSGNVSPYGRGSPDDEGDRKRSRRPYKSKTFNVEISFAAKIPMKAIANALRGQESENSQEALRVLDIILRQHAAKQGCLLVRQSFFRNSPKNFFKVGGGVLGCRGFHNSFRITQGGLSLNIDDSTTMIVQPGPVVDFLIANQNVENPYKINWVMAKRSLKNLRMRTTHTNREYKITGLSEHPCKQQLFPLKQKNEEGEVQTTEVTVYNYFVHHRNTPLQFSADFPCINVGKPKRPNYIPLELCSLVSLQRYTKALSTFQRSSLVEQSRQKPLERMNSLSYTLESSKYNGDAMLRASGVSIDNNFTRVDGRVLPAPKLEFGRGEGFVPQKGRWNLNNKTLVEPVKIDKWVVVNFSARCNLNKIIDDLIRCAKLKGVFMGDPLDVFEESHQPRDACPVKRVENMFRRMESKIREAPKLLLCLLPERKTSPLYGPWKKMSLAEKGVVTQCLAPSQKINDQYLTNVLLKINAKLGGMNSLLSAEINYSIPRISKIPTIILGMDVSHGSPGQSDVPSIAAVVGSRKWPSISSYRACVRTQSPKVEMIDSLFQKTPYTDDTGNVRHQDNGIIVELLKEFHKSSREIKPEQIIIFRDGVSESQFSQVLNVELDQIIEACKFLDDGWHPKFTMIVAQKRHHTRFFEKGSSYNVPPGTVVDNTICHARNNDFYICPHAGMIGTSRPTHYQVLYDEIGFSADELQELVHSLSYVYQRSTTAISIVAPISYAHHAASQVSQFTKFGDESDTSSGRGGVTSSSGIQEPVLPKLHKNVMSSMFFC